MTIGTLIYTWLRGEEMGRDEFGNRYYRDKTGLKRARREKRWVVYEGEAEASKVPPDWHAWLHHLMAEPPPASGLPTRKPWQAPIPRLCMQRELSSATCSPRTRLGLPCRSPCSSLAWHWRHCPLEHSPNAMAG